MAFWIGLLLAALFVGLTAKIGFFETWAMVFNITIAIYLAIFLKPVVADHLPAASQTPYSLALTMLVTAVAVFAILHGITYVAFTSQMRITFPKIIDTFGSGILSFFAGLLIWNFVYLLISVAPLCENDTVQFLGFGNDSKSANFSTLYFGCNLVNDFVASEENFISTEKAVEDILKEANPKPAEKNIIDPNDPNAPYDPNIPYE